MRAGKLRHFIDPGVAQLGSEATAAGGGSREPSEWQWSIADEVAFATRKRSGTATGSAPAGKSNIEFQV